MYFLLLWIISPSNARMEDYSNVIDLSDILNVDYMPGSLLVLENLPEENAFNNDSVANAENTGTFNEAFVTMGYHRKMMNEYLCRNFVSEQIIDEMKSSRIRRRLGKPADDESKVVGSFPSRINFSLKNQLLEDEGSTRYQEWLKKSATLEDIYRHYDNAQNREEIARDAPKETNEDYDGQITGYGYQYPQPPHAPPKLGYGVQEGIYPHQGYPSDSVHPPGVGVGSSSYGSGTGYGGGPYYSDHPPSGYGEGGSGHGHSGHGHSGHGHSGHGQSGHGHSGHGGHIFSGGHGGHQDKEKLTDLFEVALTVIAFLSFGMFLIQVIMCINAATTTTAPAMTMMPMSMGATGPEPTGGMSGDGMTGGMSGGGTGNSGLKGAVDFFYGTSVENTGGGTATGLTGIGDGGGVTGGERAVRCINRLNGEIVSCDDDPDNEDDDDGDGIVEIGRDVNDENVSTDATGGTGGTGRESNGGNIRNRRDIPVIMQPDNQALNELARKILISIESALIANQDDGNCLHKTLCENNAYSRTLKSNQKFWVPVWSLGMSWLSGILVKNVPRTTSMLDSLKASLLGLGNADCEMIYHNCELEKERDTRRKRKRR